MVATEYRALSRDIQVKDKIVYGEPVNMPKIKGFGSTVFKKMTENKDLIGQIDAFTGEKDTYGQMLERCVRVAMRMRSKGVQRGDVVVACTLNHLNTLIPTIASTFIGALPTNLHPDLSLNDTIHLMQQIEPKFLFVVPEALALLENAIEATHKNPEIVVFGQTTKYTKFEDLLLPCPEEADFVPVEIENPRETCMISFSSGTTGLPKGICLTHMGLIGPRAISPYNHIMNLMVLNFTPPYWLSGIITFLQLLDTKGTRLLYPKFDATRMWELIKYKVNVVFLPPSQLLSWCAETRPKDLETPYLKVVISGGSPITKDQIVKATEQLQTPVVNLYGMTEVSGMSFGRYIEDKEHVLKYPHSLGRPSPGFAYKVVSLDTEELLGPFQHGELRVKTDFAMNGYYGLDSSSEWDVDGYLKTGDIVYYDENFNFFHVDRAKEVIKYRSWHVPPALLERILLTHPAVHNAVVVGLPHPEDGDHPIAFVTLYNDNVTPQELEKYVEERVDDNQKLRGGVKIMHKLPMTPTGKVARQRVKQLALEGSL